MSGQLWQPCERRGCSTEPVCVDCFCCERHCGCGELPRETRPHAPQPPNDRDALLAFEAGLGQSVMCEGPRLSRLKLAPGPDLAHFHVSGWRYAFRAATTPAGRAVTVRFYGNASNAYGDEDALNEIVTPAAPPTVRQAFNALVALTERNVGYVHTGNIDARRVVAVMGGAQALAAQVRSAGPLPLMTDRSGPDGATVSPWAVSTAAQYGLTLIPATYLKTPPRPLRTPLPAECFPSVHLTRFPDATLWACSPDQEHWAALNPTDESEA